MKRKLWSMLAVAGIVSFLSHTHAQTNGSWNVNAAGNWSLATNWAGSVIPGSGGVATFSDTFGLTGGRTVTQDVLGLTLSGLTFNTPYVYTISGAQTITGSATGFTINAITSNAISPTTFGNGASITAVIAGTGGLTKTGTGTVTLGASNTFTGNVVVNQGELRVTTGDAAYGNTANNLVVDGGALRVSTTILTTSRGLSVGNNGAVIRLFVNGTFNGPITGSGLLTHQVGSVMAINGDASLFTGAIQHEAGTLTLSGFAGTTQQLGGTAGLDLAGTMLIDNSTAVNNNRIADTRGITSRGLLFNYTGNLAATSESIGNLTLEHGNTVIALTPGTGGASLTFSGVTRNNRSGLLLRATSLGATPGASVGNIIFTTSPGTLIGGGGSPSGSTTASILPYAHGSTSATATTGTSFVTWDNVTGRMIPLDLVTGYTTDITTSTPLDNVNQNVSAALGAPATINALRVAPAAAITISGSQITVNSGSILSTSTTATSAALTTISAPITTPSGVELVIQGAGGATEAAGGTFGGLRITGVISGDNGLTKTGGGVLALSGANTYTGQTTVSGGSLLLTGTIANDGVTPGPLGLSTTPIVMGSGSSNNTGIFASGGATVINRDILVIGGGSAGKFLSNVLATDSLTVNGNITITNPNNSFGNGYLTLGATAGVATPNGNITINGVISGNGGIQDASTFLPTIFLNGANTYSGGTQLNGATFNLGNNSALGTGPVYSNTATSVLAASGGARTINNPLVLVSAGIVFGGSSDINWAGNIDLNGTSTVTVNTTPGNLIVSGLLTRGTIIKAGAGTMVVSNPANSFTGITQISNGTVIVAGNAGIASGVLGTNPTTGSATVLLADANSPVTANIALLVNGPFTVGRPIQPNTNNTTGTVTVGGINTSGTATFSGFIGLNRGATPTATQLTAAPGGTVNFSGQILEFAPTGTGSPIRVIGGGNVIFSRAAGNTYTGGTIIDPGAFLFVNNTSASGTGTGAVTVNGNLGGTGIISGAVTVNSGGSIRPGNSPGALTLGGGVTFVAGSALNMELNGTTAGTLYDQLIVNGAVTLGNATLNLTSGYGATIGDMFFIVTNDGVDAITGIFNGLPDGSSIAVGGNMQVTINYTGDSTLNTTTGGNDVVLSVTAVPEPVVLALFGLAFTTATGGTYYWRRRRAQQLEMKLSTAKAR